MMWKVSRVASICALVACSMCLAPFESVHAQQLPAYVTSGPMLPLLVQMPENSWLRVNANLYSDVWTPPDLEPLDGESTRAPSTIILAWSGFAWDSNRGDLILYGGGHANSSGNDVYRWHSSNLQWERASLPSEIRNDPVSGFQAIDGVDAAPSSAHTYKNNMFLPIADRFLTWGGGAYNNGGPYLRVSETNPATTRFTGPYLFDPNRADGNKVGGTTGSHVMRVAPHPEIVGGQMWQNRDIYLHLAGQAMPDAYVDGCAAYAAEGGKDAVYVTGATGGSTNLGLYRYQLTSTTNPASDQIAKVGGYVDAPATQTTCAYAASRKLFVHTGDNSRPFFFWDLNTAGDLNPDLDVDVEATIAVFQSWLAAQSLNITNCAIEFDPVRNSFPLWCGGNAIWELHPPATNTVAGWSIAERPLPPGEAPPGESTGNGVLGKWRYAPFYNVFVGLEDVNDGNIWIYKPVGWVKPNPAGNIAPSVSITAPVGGGSVAPGFPVPVSAIASDPDGSIARVEFYVNSVKIGQATSPPYSTSFAPLLVGVYTVVAVAVDNVGGMTASSPVVFTVSAVLASATLQRGLNAYAGASDTHLVASDANTAYGSSTQLLLESAGYTPLLRFSTFQSEGGPVPDGVSIQSATLSLYKQYYDDTLQVNALLNPWVEAEATWNARRAGVAWSAVGASGAGTDYDASADALVTGDFNPGWVTFDVTSRVQQWSTHGSANYGWRVAQASEDTNFKQFYSSEYPTDPSLRPKLTVIYAQQQVKFNATATLASSANPSTAGSSVTLTATIHGSAPTGSVNFVDGGASISGCSSVSLAGAGDTRTAQCTTATLTAATHSITAVYAGDQNNNGVTSGTLSQVVNSLFNATAVLASSANPSTAGSSVTFTATIHGSAPTGSVNFVDGGASISGCSSVSLAGAGDTRTAQCTTANLAVATHSIAAVYAGDHNNNGVTSAALSQIVNPVGVTSAQLVGAASRRAHGAAGVFDLALSLTSTNPTTEPRLGPAQTVVFRFDRTVIRGTATLTEGSATVSSVTFSGSEMSVGLTGVNNQQYLTLTVSGVAALDGSTGASGSVRIGYLAGDVTQNRVVTVADVGIVNAALAQPVTASNYLRDINASGTLTVADKAIAEGNLTLALPAP